MKQFIKSFGLVFISLIFVFEVGFIPIAQAVQGVNGSVIQLTTDSFVYSFENREFKKIGLLEEGIMIPYQEKEDGYYYIQWGDTNGIIIEDDAVAINQEIIEYPKTNEGFGTSIQIIKKTKIYSSEDNAPVGEINPNQVFPLMGVSNKYYFIQIGLNLFQLEKGAAILVDSKISKDPNSGETNLKKTNAPKDATAILGFFKSDYFRVLENDLTIFDNSTGKLVPIGFLTKGQVYYRIRDYG